MAFLPIISLAATAIGAGISAYGQYQQGQAQSAYANYQAGVSTALAGIAQKEANYDVAEGGIRAQQAGFRGAADVARNTVRTAAGNINPLTGSAAQVKTSQLEITQQNENIAVADAAHAAYGEEVKAASETASAGAYKVAGITAVEAGDVGAAGSFVGGIGSVSDKWYQYTTNVGKPPSSLIYTG